MITPVNGYILVDPEFRPDKTESGFHIAYGQKLQAAPNIGTVTHMGTDIEGIKVGDKVIFMPPETQNPRGFKHDGKSYIYCKPEQIVAKIEEVKK